MRIYIHIFYTTYVCYIRALEHTKMDFRIRCAVTDQRSFVFSQVTSFLVYFKSFSITVSIVKRHCTISWVGSIAYTCLRCNVTTFARVLILYIYIYTINVVTCICTCGEFTVD